MTQLKTKTTCVQNNTQITNLWRNQHTTIFLTLSFYGTEKYRFKEKKTM
jgi:hypothetical protein